MINGIFQTFDTINQSTVINTSYAYSPNIGTPIPIIIFMGSVTILFLFACLVLPLRIGGQVNVARVATSLMATLISGITAYSSIVIDCTDGVAAVSSFSNYTVIQSIHTLVQVPQIPIFFVACGFIAFSNLVYCLFTKEIIQSEPSEFKSGDGKVKAEQGKRQTEEEAQ